jgi:hypothetical protein
MAGVADSAFYASVQGFLAKTNPPILARAAVDFMHGIAAWDYTEASRASNPLVVSAASGDAWLDGDELRDGAVMAKLEVGDRRAAREVFRALVHQSTRDISDLRTRLLFSYVSDTAGARTTAARP